MAKNFLKTTKMPKAKEKALDEVERASEDLQIAKDFYHDTVAMNPSGGKAVFKRFCIFLLLFGAYKFIADGYFGKIRAIVEPEINNRIEKLSAGDEVEGQKQCISLLRNKLGMADQLESSFKLSKYREKKWYYEGSLSYSENGTPFKWKFSCVLQYSEDKWSGKTEFFN
ncbi:MAG: hypothetical protein HN509_09805 [Halobacteriovoraceae bacterium]|jgi:hypothetical protein|nr:hypothetical protein [Halobacteriovoraceae bacterium]MBT5093168.1 hypothetical protein [Halobacteriovoraceae bacterium]